MFKKLLTISMVLMLTTLVGCDKEKKEVTTIGISQLVEHPALDLAREGFVKELEEQGFKEGKNIKIEIGRAHV